MMNERALQEGCSKIYVTNDKIKRLAAADDWAFGSRRDTFEPGHWVPKMHVMHDQVVSTHGTEAAKLELWAALDEQERQMRAHLGLEFVEHQDRIYLYVTDRDKAKELNARYCKVRKQFFAPKAEAEFEKIEPYISPVAKKSWETSLAERRRKHWEKKRKLGEFTKECLIGDVGLGHNQPSSLSTINSLETPKFSPKPKGRVSLKRVAETVAYHLFTIDPDLIASSNAEVARRVQFELAYCGIEYKFTSVCDALTRNLGGGKTGLEEAFEKTKKYFQ